MKKINVLSLFGGIECGKVAMDRLGWDIAEYFSSEIDPYAIKITNKNFPKIIHIGDVKDIRYDSGVLQWETDGCLQETMQVQTTIDLIIGGSPCQDLSIAKNGGKGLHGEKSGLFYEYVRILKEVRPKYFLLENVASMKQSDRDEITRVLIEAYPDTQIHRINSAIVSAQNRKRLYWTNIPGITQPEDREILLRDILEDIPFDDSRWKPLDEKYIDHLTEEKIQKHLKLQKSHSLTASYDGAVWWNSIERKQRTVVIGQFRRADLRIHSEQEKACTLTSNMGTGGNNVPIVMGNFSIYDENIDTEKSTTLGSNSDYPTAKIGQVILGLAHRNRGNGKKPEINMQEKSNAVTTVPTDSEVFAYIPEATKKGFCEISDGDCVDMAQENSKTRRGRLMRNKSNALTTSNHFYYVRDCKDRYLWRKLTPIECERLQTLPDDYTDCVSNSRRYKAIGNGWTVDVIAHLLSFCKF